MEPEHLARDDISALAWDIEETSGERRKTRLNDWTQAFLVVELNRKARQSSGVASAVKMPRNRSALARALLARSMPAARSCSREGPAGRLASAAITAAASASGSDGRKNIADWPSCSRWTGISDTISGRPSARASSMTVLHPSNRDG